MTNFPGRKNHYLLLLVVVVAGWKSWRKEGDIYGGLGGKRVEKRKKSGWGWVRFSCRNKRRNGVKKGGGGGCVMRE